MIPAQQGGRTYRPIYRRAGPHQRMLTRGGVLIPGIMLGNVSQFQIEALDQTIPIALVLFIDMRPNSTINRAATSHLRNEVNTVPTQVCRCAVSHMHHPSCFCISALFLPIFASAVSPRLLCSPPSELGSTKRPRGVCATSLQHARGH